MCNKIIRKFQGKKLHRITVVAKKNEPKKERKNYDGEEVEALDWVSVKQQFYIMHTIPIHVYAVRSMLYNSVRACVCACECLCSFFSAIQKEIEIHFFSSFCSLVFFLQIRAANCLFVCFFLFGRPGNKFMTGASTVFYTFISKAFETIKEERN